MGKAARLKALQREEQQQGTPATHLDAPADTIVRLQMIQVIPEFVVYDTKTGKAVDRFSMDKAPLYLLEAHIPEACARAVKVAYPNIPFVVDEELKPRSA